MKRRWLLGGGVLALCGCGSVTSPPTRWYELRSDPPLPATASATAAAADAAAWELGDVHLPGMLDRDTLVVGRGAAGVVPLVGHRWAEPLRDRVPQLLALDLGRLRGAGRTWLAPAPPGVPIARRLRVDVLVLQAESERRTLRLAAQWWLFDPRADATPPLAGHADFEVAIEGASVDGLAAAHRLALWRLAERIAASGQRGD